MNRTAVAMAALNLMVLACLLLVEAWALINPRRGDTISEGMWALYRQMGSWKWALALPLMVLLTWAGIHRAFELSHGWKAVTAATVASVVAGMLTLHFWPR